MTKKIQVKDGAFVVLVRHKKTQVFLILRSDKKIWNLPGGGIEPCESPSQAAARETLEETGFIVDKLSYIGSYINLDIRTKENWNRTHLFTASSYTGTYLPEFHGCKGQWYPINNLPKNIQRITLVRINDALRGDTFFEKVFDPTTS